MKWGSVSITDEQVIRNFLPHYVVTNYTGPDPFQALDRLVAENKRLREALEEIAAETWNPAIGLPGKSIPELHVIARNALHPETQP